MLKIHFLSPFNTKNSFRYLYKIQILNLKFLKSLFLAVGRLVVNYLSFSIINITFAFNPKNCHRWKDCNFELNTMAKLCGSFCIL
jgi:hypothetical protein